MFDSEKLMALKKAYADIILNTAKEAAVRIMVSERKSMRYQQELFVAKEDGLRMLIRLKQMLDAKVNEAQVASLCQQQKIEELEAQLGEAKDIVKDLRAELREAQDELEMATINQKQLLDEQNSNGDAATLVTIPIGNRFDSSETVMSSLPDAPSELFVASDMRNSTLNSTYESNTCYVVNGSHKDNCYFCNSDIASIVMRRKEPKLYRNGCTQRIHAFERNLLEGNLSLPGKVENVKNGTCTGEDEEDLCKNSELEADKMCAVEDSPNEIKLKPEDSNCVSVRPFKSFRWKRKRAARYRKSRTLSRRNFSDQVVETTQNSDFSSGTFLDAVNNNFEYEEESKIFENKAEKEPESVLTLNLPSDTIEMILQSGHGEVTGSDTVQNTANEDDLLTDTVELTRPESSPAEHTEVPACETDIEAITMSLVNSKSSNLTERITTQSLNDKFLKYTFQRKRKKEFLNCPDGYSSFEEGAMKRKMVVENLNGSLESANSKLITESFLNCSLESANSKLITESF